MWPPVRCTESRGRAPPRFLSAVRTRRRRRSKRESLAMLLLLPFLAEDVLAAVLDALALVRLGLAPLADLGGELADGLLVDAADQDRGLVGRLHVQAFGHVEIDIVALAELELELVALRVRTIADAGDLEGLGEALGHALDQVRDQRALHAPERPRRLGSIGRLDHDRIAFDGVADLLAHPQGEIALGPLHAEHAVLDSGSDPARDRHRHFADAAHQNTSASTSPPTFCARASASESTPRGVETMVMPRPLRTVGSSRLPE